jgi:hypothetical protein
MYMYIYFFMYGLFTLPVVQLLLHNVERVDDKWRIRRAGNH